MHTPGPWEIKEESVGGRVYKRVIGARYPGGYKPIATMMSGFSGFGDDSKLIAAAPDLLEACRSMLIAYEEGDEEAVIEARDKAVAAILKATRGQP